MEGEKRDPSSNTPDEDREFMADLQKASEEIEAELQAIEKDERLDQKIDISNILMDFRQELHEAEFPGEGSQDLEKIKELHHRIQAFRATLLG